MIKRGILFAGLVLILFLVGCANKVPVSETLPELVIEETNIALDEGTATLEESPSIDVTLDQSAVPETEVQEIKVQEPKCSREFSPQFNAEPYYSGPLFDAHFHMPPPYEEIAI